MFDFERLAQQELSFCRSFTNTALRDYGFLYYNPLNPLSHDSNHAHILTLRGDLDGVIRDIADFYIGRHLTPRIYQSFVKGELATLRPHLESRGFTVQTFPSVFMRVGASASIRADSCASIQRILQVTNDVIELIHTDEAGDWTINVLRTHLDDGQFHLLGLFDAGKCVSIASVKVMDGCSRVDDVKTHAAFRNRHFGTELTSRLIAYHQVVSDNYLYLWATNPIAIRMYGKVGFEVIDVDRPCWSAYIEPEAARKF